MKALRRGRAVRIAAAAAGAVAALALAGFVFAWSGIYSVAASSGHWRVISWLLDFGMRSSVRTHAIAIDAPSLEDRDLVRLGAGHFHGGCAYCHGAPGTRISPVAQQMLPPPPPLAGVASAWRDNELFWIVKHGIKYTGMPGWVSLRRDDEVWAVVAFLRELPGLDVESYRELALQDVDIASSSGQQLARIESSPEAAGACARCHGAGRTGPSSSLVPILHGQPAEYLVGALRNYANGTRTSGIMQPVASDLEPDAVTRVAAYYASLPPPVSRAPPAGHDPDPAAIERGRVLATAGAPDLGVPGCDACHGADALATFPRLAGQHARYMTGQLRLWRRGLNAASETGAIMAPLADRLSERQSADAAAYYASLAAAGGSKESRR